MKRLLSLTALAFALSTSFATDRPNILLITADDLGLQLSCYGDPHIKTPHIDALAASGVLFETTYVAQASCSSSRASILTGRYPHTNGQVGLSNAGFAMKPEQADDNLVRHLKDAGYQTGIIGKLHVSPTTAFPFDTMIHRPTKDFDFRDVRQYAELAGEFLASAPADAPFFLMVNFIDPHVLHDKKAKRQYFPAQWLGLPENPFPARSIKGFPFHNLPHPVLFERTTNYYSTIKRLDDGIGMLMSQLEQADKLDSTVIFFVSDHGPPFTRAKTTCYEAGLRVPFLVKWPKTSEAGRRSEELVSTVDIAPTIYEAAGISGAGVTSQGKSLKPILGDEQKGTPFRHHVVAEFTYHGEAKRLPRRAIRGQRFKLIRNYFDRSTKAYTGVDGDPAIRLLPNVKNVDPKVRAAFVRSYDQPEVELYDLQNDPHEFTNLANKPEFAEIKAQLTKALIRWQKQTEDPLLEEFPEG